MSSSRTRQPGRRHRRIAAPAVGCALCGLLLFSVSESVASDGTEEEDKDGKHETSRLTDVPIPVADPDDFVQRPRPLLELGNPFLGTGTLHPGFRLPGGAVWQPSLLLFGTLRSAMQSFDGGSGSSTSEWANRLDLFFNVGLSGTERLVVGFRPLDENGAFSGYTFSNGTEGWNNAFNGDFTTLFFEGEFGELFPNLDKSDSASLDVGFAVGRQPLSYQDGMLIDDTIDSIGVIRNTLLPPGASDLQVTFLYGWNEIHRDDNVEDDRAQLVGVFIQSDLPKSTINADVAVVFDTETNTDGIFAGFSSVQRLGHTNSTFRILGSHALDEESAAVSDGYLLFGELSWTPAYSHNLVYANAFWGIDRFSSAARGPDTGGPLGRAGILFAAVGMGRYGAALGNRADDSAGFAVGHQRFYKQTRRQVIFELGARSSTTNINNDDAIAIGVRFQQALGQHFVVQLDGFGSLNREASDGSGARVELRYLF